MASEYLTESEAHILWVYASVVSCLAVTLVGVLTYLSVVDSSVLVVFMAILVASLTGVVCTSIYEF